MTDKPKVRIVVDETPEIVARLDAIAEAEGLARADVLRRAIRRLVFSMPDVPDFGKSPEPTEPISV